MSMFLHHVRNPLFSILGQFIECWATNLNLLEVHGFSDQLVIFWQFLPGRELHKNFAELSSWPANTKVTKVSSDSFNLSGCRRLRFKCSVRRTQRNYHHRHKLNSLPQPFSLSLLSCCSPTVAYRPGLNTNRMTKTHELLYIIISSSNDPKSCFRKYSRQVMSSRWILNMRNI